MNVAGHYPVKILFPNKLSVRGKLQQSQHGRKTLYSRKVQKYPQIWLVQPHASNIKNHWMLALLQKKIIWKLHPKHSLVYIVKFYLKIAHGYLQHSEHISDTFTSFTRMKGKFEPTCGLNMLNINLTYLMLDNTQRILH